jgi:Ca2+-binding EF-hand superfamily protein
MKSFSTVLGKLIVLSLEMYRDELSQRRRNMVLKAFAMMDKDGSGVIQVKDI